MCVECLFLRSPSHGGWLHEPCPSLYHEPCPSLFFSFTFLKVTESRWVAPDPLMVGIRSGLRVVGSCTLESWVRFPNERNQGKQAHPVSLVKYRVPHGSQSTKASARRLSCALGNTAQKRLKKEQNPNQQLAKPNTST